MTPVLIPLDQILSVYHICTNVYVEQIGIKFWWKIISYTTLKQYVYVTEPGAVQDGLVSKGIKESLSTAQ